MHSSIPSATLTVFKVWSRGYSGFKTISGVLRRSQFFYITTKVLFAFFPHSLKCALEFSRSHRMCDKARDWMQKQVSPIKPDKADLQKSILFLAIFFVLENTVIFVIYVICNGFITVSFQWVNFSVLISIIVNIKENPHKQKLFVDLNN